MGAKPLRICLIGPTSPFRGGISHYTTIFHRHLKKKHETLFVTFIRQYPKWLFPGKTDIDPSQKQINDTDVQRILDPFRPVTWFFTAKSILDFNPDLVIFPWWVSYWAPQFWVLSSMIKKKMIKKKLKPGIVFLCHNVVAHESTWIDHLLTKAVLRNGDGFLVHSDDDYRNLKALLPKALIQKIHHPTYSIFNMSHPHELKTKTLFEIKGPLLLFFGFVRPYKGLKYLIKALPEILKTHNARLMIAGEFWKDKKEYLAMIEDLSLKEHILIIDKYIPNEEVSDYFLAADLVVQPYTSATGSGVVQTAFAFGKPVVATRVGSLPDAVSDGRTGFIVEPKSPKAIAKAVTEFLSLSDKTIFKKNIEKERLRFSWNNLVTGCEVLQRNIKTNHLKRQ